jgi:hypothetical protein
MREAADWLRRYERFWSTSLDRLAAYAEAKEAKVKAEMEAAEKAKDAEGRR